MSLVCKTNPATCHLVGLTPQRTLNFRGKALAGGATDFFGAAHPSPKFTRSQTLQMEGSLNEILCVLKYPLGAGWPGDKDWLRCGFLWSETILIF